LQVVGSETGDESRVRCELELEGSASVYRTRSGEAAIDERLQIAAG
jgi:hypothetical protein